MPHLEIRKKRRRRSRYFVFNGEAVSIGRSSRNALVLHDYAVSRMHCVIEPSVQGPIVRDLDSTRGIRVNESTVKEAVLKNGDCVHVGPYQLYFHLDDAPGFETRQRQAPDDHAELDESADARAASGSGHHSAEFELLDESEEKRQEDVTAPRRELEEAQRELSAIRQQMAEREARILELDQALNEARASITSHDAHDTEHAAAMDVLHERLDDATKNLARRDAEIESLTKKLRAQEATAAELEKSFKVTERETARLHQRHSTEIDGLRATIHEARREKDRAEKELADLRQKLLTHEESDQARVAMETERSSLESRIADLEAALDAAKNEQTELEQAVAQLRSENEERGRLQESEASAHHADVEAIKADLAERDARIERHRQEAETLAQERAQLGESLEAARQHAEQLQQDLEQLRIESGESEQARQTAERGRETIEAERDDLEETVREARAKITSANDRIASLEARILATDESVQALASKLLAAARERESVHQQLAAEQRAREAAERRTAEVTQERSELQKTVEAAQRDRDELEQQRQSDARELETARAELSSLRQQIGLLEHANEVTKSERDEAAAERDRLRSELEQAELNLASASHASEDRHVRESADTSELRAKLDAVQSSLTEREDELVSLRPRYAALEKRRDEAMAEAQTARANSIDLRRQIEHLRAALDEKDEALSAIQRGDYEIATPAEPGELATIDDASPEGPDVDRERAVMAGIFNNGGTRPWRTAADRDWGTRILGGFVVLIIIGVIVAGTMLYMKNYG